MANHLCEAARAAAERSGCALEVFDLNVHSRIATSARILEARGVRGLIIPFHRNRDDLNQLPLERFVSVELGYAVIAHPAIDRVTTSDFEAMQMVWREPQARGYRRIVRVLANGTNTNSEGVWEAACLHEQQKAAPERGLATLSVLRESLSGVNGSFVFQRWYREERPDAIIARKSLRTHLTALGLVAPDDVGYVNLGVPDERSATSGTIFDPVEISRNAVDLLDQAAGHNRVGIPATPRTLLLEPRWNEGTTLRKRCASP